MLAGKGAVGFWLQLIAVISAIVLLSNKGTDRKPYLLFTGAIVSIIAIYLTKSNLLQAELFNPLLTYPGPPVYGGVTGPYIPSLVEIGLSLGIVSLGCLLLALGFRKLNLGE